MPARPMNMRVLTNVEKQLQNTRVQQAEGRPAPATPVEDEPEPIFLLDTRRHTSDGVIYARQDGLTFCEEITFL